MHHVQFKIFLYIFVGLSMFACTPESDQISIGTRHTIHSDILGEDREIFIHVPDGFYHMNETDVSYPVVYVLDGESLFHPAVGILEQMSAPFSANDRCPLMMVVGIPNTNRNRDLTPTKAIIGTDSTSLEITGGGPKMLQFIKEELIPYIDKNFATTPQRSLVGHSLGGLFVMNALMREPDLFSNYLLIDPALSWDKNKFLHSVTDHLKKNAFQNKSLYLASANVGLPGMSFEDIKKDTNDMVMIPRSNLLFLDEMKKVTLQGLAMKNHFYENETHFTIPLIALLDGFQYFYKDYSFSKMEAYFHPDSPQREKDIVEEITTHFQNVSNDYGYQVLPKESYINSWAFGFEQYDQPEITEQLLNYNIGNYPNSAHVYAAKGFFLLWQQDTLRAMELFEQSIAIKKIPDVVEQYNELK